MANGDVDTEVGDQITQSTIESNMPSAAPKAELVKDPNNAPRATPPDPDAKQKEYYEQQRIDRYNEEQDQIKKHDQLLKQYYDRILSIKNAAHPELPKLEKELPQPGSEQDPNRNKQNVGQIFGQVMALSTIAATVFGRRHGMWGRAIQQMGIGEFLKAYSAGQHQQAEDQLHNWQQANEAIKQRNRDAINDYNDILKDRHLTLSEQHEAIAEHAALLNDDKMYQAAAAKDLAGIEKNIAAKEKADFVTSKSALKLLETIQKNYFTNKNVRSWVDHVTQESGGKLDPRSSPQALWEAEHKYPMSDWVKDSKPFDKDKGIEKTESGLPIYNVTQAKQQPVGTEFVSPNGTRYKVISQDPFQVQKME